MESIAIPISYANIANTSINRGLLNMPTSRVKWSTTSSKRTRTNGFNAPCSWSHGNTHYCVAINDTRDGKV